MTAAIAHGSIWGGGGMCVRVIEVVGDPGDKIIDVRVERLTGQRGLLKRPASPGVIPLREFEKFMRPLDLSRTDPWTVAIKDRYANV